MSDGRNAYIYIYIYIYIYYIYIIGMRRRRITVRADDWAYLCEGGRHAIFAPRTSSSSSSSAAAAAAAANDGVAAPPQCAEVGRNPRGLLLRVDKQLLARAAAAAQAAALATTATDDADQGDDRSGKDQDDDTAATAAAVDDESDIDDGDDRFQEMMACMLCPYIDRPAGAGECGVVGVTWAVLADLAENARTSGSIPEQRRGDWVCRSGEIARNRGAARNNLPRCTVMRDYRRTVAPTPALDDNAVNGGSGGAVPSSFSLEIKPKAGYLAFSPLVDPERRIKFQSSRFALLQTLYLQRKDDRGWMSAANEDTAGSFQVSSYDPLDLFSGDARRISEALRCLLRTPQNNLKIWIRDQQLHPTAFTGEDCHDWKALGRMFNMSHPGTEPTAVTERMIDLVGYVLSEERFLGDLLRLQLLDFLDADGAVLVYNRLVHLCNGCHETAEGLVDDCSRLAVKQEGDRPHQCAVPFLGAAPFPLPDDCESISHLIHEISVFHEKLVECSPSLPESDFLDEAHQGAVRLVSDLTVDSCCYLLRCWLLSLVACDISFFLTFNKVSADDHGGKQRIVPQQEGNPGRLVYKARDGELVVISYELKAIDFDKKPARKLRVREKNEILFNGLLLR
jgi:Inositol-pentakisphosphate 2-kinase